MEFASLAVVIAFIFIAYHIVIPAWSLVSLMVSNFRVGQALKRNKDILQHALDWGQLHCPGHNLSVEPAWERRGFSLNLVVRVTTQKGKKSQQVSAPTLSEYVKPIVRKQTWLLAWPLHLLLLPQSLFKRKDVTVLPITPLFCTVPIGNNHDKIQAAKRMATCSAIHPQGSFP